MNKYARLTRTALAAFVVAVTLCSCTSAVPTVPASPSPSPSPLAASTAPSSSPSPAASASPTVPASVGPALTETFTSAIHGITISYPAGWSAQPASEPWTAGPFFFQEPVGDFLYDTSLTDHLFLALASQPLAGRSPDTWAADLLALEGCGTGAPVVVDGAEGVIATDCGMALISIDDRGYMIRLYVSGDDPEVGEVYDRAWFDQVLATVQLNPQDALGRYAEEFSVPFTYLLPAEPEFDYGATNATYFEVRVPAWAEAGRPGGVILQAIGSGLVDPCDKLSNYVPIEARPQAVIDYLKTVPGVEVAEESETRVGDLPAVQASVVVGPGTPKCLETWPWAEQTESIPQEIPLRMVAVDVGNEHFVFSVFGEADNPGWRETADELIDSFRFEPLVSPGASPTGG